MVHHCCHPEGAHATRACWLQPCMLVHQRRSHTTNMITLCLFVFSTYGRLAPWNVVHLRVLRWPNESHFIRFPVTMFFRHQQSSDVSNFVFLQLFTFTNTTRGSECMGHSPLLVSRNGRIMRKECNAVGLNLHWNLGFLFLYLSLRLSLYLFVYLFLSLK